MMLGIHLGWNEAERQQDESWHDEGIIEVADYWQEVRYQIERKCCISHRRSKQESSSSGCPGILI